MKHVLIRAVTIFSLSLSVSALVNADPGRHGPSHHGGGFGHRPPPKVELHRHKPMLDRRMVPAPRFHQPKPLRPMHWHQGRWHQGRWHHGYHGGRLGWWWISAGVWHYYAKPMYPYPVYEERVVIEQTPVTVVEPNTPQHWYLCESVGEYYPYVSTCPEGWREVPIKPAGE